jgi:glycosyl transferase family 61
MTSNATILFLKYRRHFNRLFAGPGTLEAAAHRQEIIHPEESATYLPAIHLDGQLERVTGSPAESTKAQEIESVTKLSGRHAPTIAYHLKDVALVDGSVYSGTMRFFVRDLEAPGSVEPIDLDRAALVSSYYGVKYFGHWLRDDCTLHLLARDLDMPPLCLPGPSGLHIEGYKSLFDQSWTPTLRAYIKQLTIFSDHHQNGLRRQRYERLRAIVAARFPRGAARSFVYLKRGADGVPRTIHNEDEIVRVLAASGFTVLDTASTPLDELLGTLVNAKVVVSLEGSHIAHCVYSMPSDSGLLVLEPADRFSANQRLWTDCLGIRSGFVVGALKETGYEFDPIEIRRTLDLLERAIA